MNFHCVSTDKLIFNLDYTQNHRQQCYRALYLVIVFVIVFLADFEMHLISSVLFI